MATGQTALMAGHCEGKEFHYSDLCTWHSPCLGTKCGSITSAQPCSSFIPTCACLLSPTAPGQAAPPAQQRALPHLANIPVAKKSSWSWGFLGSSTHSTNQLYLAEGRLQPGAGTGKQGSEQQCLQQLFLWKGECFSVGCSC